MKSKTLVVVLMLLAAPAYAADAPDIPVLAAMPQCALQRVGGIEASDGREPVANAREASMSSADYGRALAELSRAGGARGANAVVVAGQNAVFYTRGNRPSARPVYIHLDGVAVRLADPARCTVRAQDPDELLRRAIRQRGAPTPMQAGTTN